MILLAAALATCTLFANGDEWQGKCGPIDDDAPVITLTRTNAITSGIWRNDIRPKEVFAGDSDLPDDMHQSVELEVYRGNWGVLRTAYK